MEEKSTGNMNSSNPISSPESGENLCVISPIKQTGKLSLGFRGFKLINSNIKLLNKVEVKTSMLKQEHPTNSSLTKSGPMLSLPSVRSTSEPSQKLSTAEALRKIRERIQLKKGNQLTEKIGQQPPANGLKKVQISEDGTDSSKQSKPEQLLKNSPVKSTEASKHSVERLSNNNQHLNSCHGHSHRSHENRHARDRSPHQNDSLRSSRNETKQRKESSRHRSSHSYRHSTSNSHYSARSRSRDRNSSHSHHHHSRRRSWETDRRKSRRNDHHEKDTHSKRKSSTSEVSSDSNISAPSVHRTSKHTSHKSTESKDRRNSASESSEKEHNLSERSTDSEYVTGSAFSSVESDVDTSLSCDPCAESSQTTLESKRKENEKVCNNISPMEQDSNPEKVVTLEIHCATNEKSPSTSATSKSESYCQANEETQSGHIFDIGDGNELNSSKATVLNPLNHQYLMVSSCNGTIDELDSVDDNELTDEVEAPQQNLSHIHEDSATCKNLEISKADIRDTVSENASLEDCTEEKVQQDDTTNSDSVNTLQSTSQRLKPLCSDPASPDTVENLHSNACSTSHDEMETLNSAPLQENPQLPPSPPSNEQSDFLEPLAKKEDNNDTIHPNSTIKRTESKIPTIASQLKTVFESILHTDFSTVEKVASSTKFDDVAHRDTTFEHTEDGTDYSLDIRTNCTKQTSDQSSVCSGNKTEDEETEDNSKVENQVALSVITIPVDSPQKVNHISPCNKLKLHATTKTPLPAKKSYIQQAQINTDMMESLTSEKKLPSAEEEIGPSADSSNILSSSKTALPCESLKNDANQEMLKNVSLALHLSEVQSEKCMSDNDRGISGSDLGFSQQDSTGSTPSDTDDGLRRSERIKTKKNEKTRTVQTKLNSSLSETNQQTPPDVSLAASIDQLNQNLKLEKQLSEIDYFKLKIRLAEDTEVPELFEVLEENVYLNGQKKSRARKEIRRMVCECALEEESPDNKDPPCGENCLNRLLMIECSSRCPFGVQCTNKRFQQKQYAPTEVFKTDFKGWGIRAASEISAGQLIMEYCGEVVDQREFTQRSLEYSESNHEHFYFMALSQDEIIDAAFKGNASRFINHSCDPNAETQKWTVNGRLRVGFFTLRNIPKGEEITFDYQFERYGKVAQKCYCGTAKCRGYLGKAPEDDKKSKVSKKGSDQNLTVLSGDSMEEQNEKERRKTKKKLSLFEDNTMEKELSRLLGGLCSTKEVLALSRLMVRCDTYSQRVLCLQVLKETTSQTRLKTFLNFHGLSIIWSWMVDISGSDHAESNALKFDIIGTLCKLPITNRNVIEDSKVLSVVKRWAEEGHDAPSPTPDENESENEKKFSTVSEDKVSKEKCLEDSEKTETEEMDDAPAATTDNITSSPRTEEKTLKKELSVNESSEESERPTFTEEKANADVTAAAKNLLDSWKDLREIYRIPKRPKPASSPVHEPRSRDNSHSRTSSPLSKRLEHEDKEHWSNRRLRRASSSQERWRDSSEQSYDSERNWSRHNDHWDSRLSPSQYRNEGRWECSRRKRRLSTDSDELSLNGKQGSWINRTPRNRMSRRQEYRKKFEKDVQKRELEKKRRLEEVNQLDPLMSIQMPMNNTIQMPIPDISMNEQCMPAMMAQQEMAAQQLLPNNATFTSSGYSGNLIQINPSPHLQTVMQSYIDQDGNQHLGVMPQVIMQQNLNSMAMQMPVQHNYNAQGMFNQDPNMQETYAITNPNMQNQQVGTFGQQIISSGTAIISQQPEMTVQQQPTMQVQQQPHMQEQTALLQPNQPNPNVTILGSQNGQAIVLLSAEQLQKLTQGIQTGQQAQPEQSESFHSTSLQSQPVNMNKAEPSTSKEEKNSNDPTKLPPNWKVANDAEGRIYYYHAITRQTQWDPPTWDGKEEDMIGKKEAEMDLSTPTYDERKKTSKSQESNITEEGKKAKDNFRLKMSKFVVQCLGAFRKKDCKVGRITSTEDFKHLARKLTHNIMMKEIKQVKLWEDLDFNANVRHKTKEYVKKYMSRVGPVYHIRDDNPLDPS